MNEKIRKLQKSDWALERLAAQRLLYRQVKSTENWRLVSILLVAVLLLVGLVAEVGPFSQGATMAVVLLWFFDQVVLVRFIGRKKEEAAAIQEDFDCRVLNIPWPDHVGVAYPTGDRVKVLAKRARRAGVEQKDLANWYRAEDVPVDPLRARLHCQRVNCDWDSRLRGEWMCCVRFAVGGVVAAGVVVGATVGITLLEVVLGVAASIRLLAWLCVERRAQLTAQKRMKDLHEYLSRTSEAGGPTTVCDSRLVQAAIFEHRRTCPTVPEWYYRLRRKAYEGKGQP